MVDVLVVEIGHSSADITAQFDLLPPAEADVIPGQQLLQTASANILGGGGKDMRLWNASNPDGIYAVETQLTFTAC